MAGNFRGHTFNALMQPRAVYDRPLTFRGAIAPLGTYQNPDGTEDVGFAWPGIITEPLKALQRLHENSYTEDGRLGMPNPEYQGNKDDALTALLSIYAGNALNPATRLPENALGMFAGRNAKTANLKALSRAEDMAGKGASREDIWNDTGWFQGPDQKWRFEIDDSGQRLLKMPDDLSKIDRPIASDMVFKHDALHEAYPAVADTPWYYTPNIDGGGASYDATRGIRVSSAPSLSYDTGGIGGVTLHEQQHAIQQIEDFARGGNREMGHKLDDVKREAQQAYEATARKQASGIRTADDELLAELGISEPVASKPWDGLSLREQLEWYDAGRGRVYNRLSGETEARNVQTRMNMSAEERRATPPWETQDVPDDQQIVRFLSDTGKPSLMGSAISSAGHDVSGSGAVTKPKGITAYHGSPHDFNKFDLSKIGTGEGAQAYGHGLYFAENEGVANSYRRKLSQGYSDGIGMAREALMLTGGDFEKAIAHVLRGKDSYGKRWGNDPNRLPFGKLYDDAVRELRLKPEGLAPSGHMYQVRINADPNDFLDWDLPLSQQKNIKNALEKVGHGVFADSALFGSSVAPKPSEISKYVEAGIPGIKYLDGNSRAAGDGSRNYVVFDDSLIEILKKYGLAGGAIGAGSLFDFNTEQQY